MKRLFLYILTFFVLVACHSEFNQVVDYKDLSRSFKNGYMQYQKLNFTGTAIDSIPSQKLKEFNYVDGLKHGLCKKWYANGQLNYEAFYKNGRKEGLTKVWYKNGQLQRECVYRKGVEHGKIKIWYPTGELQKELNYHLGLEQGLQKAWRKNGKLYANYEAINGRFFGLRGSNMCYQVSKEGVKK